MNRPKTPPREPTEREKSIQRDDEQCVFCDLTHEEHREQSPESKDIESHHIVPDRVGGSDKMENRLTVCNDCHQELEKVTKRLFDWLRENELESLKDTVTTDDTREKYSEIIAFSNAWGKLGRKREDINQLANEHHRLRESFNQLPHLLAEHGIELASNPLEDTTKTGDLVPWLPRLPSLHSTGLGTDTGLTSRPTAERPRLIEDENSLRARSAGDPVRLRYDQSGWLVNIGIEATAARFSGGDHVLVDLKDMPHCPLLTISQLADPPSNPGQNPLMRKLMDRGDTIAVTIPPRHITDRGLGLAGPTYNNNNPLLLKPLVETGVVGLEPTNYYDGTAYVLPDYFSTNTVTSPDKPTTSEGIGPIPPDAVTAAAQTTGVSAATVERALDLLAIDRLPAADVLSAHRLADYDPVETPDATVYVVASDVWDALDATSGFDADVQQAVRFAHVRAAESLLNQYAPAADARGFATAGDAVVVSHE